MDIKSERKSTRSYRVIVSEIRKLIKEGKLAPGDQLLPERQLAEKLGVSRPTIREALSALEYMGQVEVTKAGAIITGANMESLIEPLADALLSERENVMHLLELRRILEGQVARLAAQRATEVDLLRLRESVVSLWRCVETAQPHDAEDVAFHQYVAEASRNPLICNVMTMISGLMNEHYEASRRKLNADIGRARVYARQHQEIYEAIAAQDPNRAEAKIMEHITMVEQFLREHEELSPYNGPSNSELSRAVGNGNGGR
ncbi:MAG: FadR family transcriptional regulator [Firmicutes bacterium]|nr:FadR family transcriptional regulator [Bacillota bacterium]